MLVYQRVNTNCIINIHICNSRMVRTRVEILIIKWHEAANCRSFYHHFAMVGDCWEFLNRRVVEDVDIDRF